MASRLPRCMARLMLTQPSLPKSGEEPQGTAGCRGAGGTGRAPGLSPTEVAPASSNPQNTSLHQNQLLPGEKRGRRELPKLEICTGPGDLK